jgi:hypothetical protein
MSIMKENEIMELKGISIELLNENKLKRFQKKIRWEDK